MHDSHTGQRCTNERIFPPAGDHGNVASSSVQRDAELNAQHLSSGQCSSGFKSCSLDSIEFWEEPARIQSQSPGTKRKAWLEACLKDVQKSRKRKILPNATQADKGGQCDDELDGFQNRKTAGESLSEAHAWRIDRLFGAACHEEAVPQSGLCRDGCIAVHGDQMDVQEANPKLSKRQVLRNTGLRKQCRNSTKGGHDVEYNCFHGLKVPTPETRGKEFGYFMAGFIEGITSAPTAERSTSQRDVRTPQEPEVLHSTLQDSLSDLDLEPSRYGWSCARALTMDVIRSQKYSKRNMDEWLPKVERPTQMPQTPQTCCHGGKGAMKEDGVIPASLGMMRK